VIVTCEESGHDYMIIIRLILNRFNIGSYLYWNLPRVGAESECII
jgi:hypothetical protein